MPIAKTEVKNLLDKHPATQHLSTTAKADLAGAIINLVSMPGTGSVAHGCPEVARMAGKGGRAASHGCPEVARMSG